MVFNNIDALHSLRSSRNGPWMVTKKKSRKQLRAKKKNRIQSGRLSGLMMSSAPIQLEAQQPDYEPGGSGLPRCKSKDHGGEDRRNKEVIGAGKRQKIQSASHRLRCVLGNLPKSTSRGSDSIRPFLSIFNSPSQQS